jgi:hypothetical protein
MQEGITSVSRFEETKPTGTMAEIDAMIEWIERAATNNRGVYVVPASVAMTRIKAIKRKFKAGE